MKLKEFWKKFWFILWKDDSFKGWLLSIIFLFVFIKFIFFPILSLITRTSLPLAIVESCSMHHKTTLGIIPSFDNWWSKHEEKYSQFSINENGFRDFSLKNSFTKGDILFVVGIKPEKLKIGDVIIFNVNQQHPVIHRIINIKEETGERIFSTIGDNNNAQIPFETNIKQNQIVGKAVFKIAPYIGWVKLIFFEYKQPASNKGFCEEN
jgi:signal peptidase I